MHKTKWIVAALGWALASSVAQATFLTGTFSGSAVNSERVQGVEMWGDFDGARVNGSFGFSSTGNGASPWLRFDVPGIVSYDFTGETAAHFFNDGSSDIIELTANDGLMIPHGFFRIGAPTGSLSLVPGGGLDLSTFDPGSIALQYLSGHFGARRDCGRSLRPIRLQRPSRGGAGACNPCNVRLRIGRAGSARPQEEIPT